MKPTEQMIEAGARAIHEVECGCGDFEFGDPEDEGYIEQARAALTAALASVPEPIGWAVRCHDDYVIPCHSLERAKATAASATEAFTDSHLPATVCALVPWEDTP